MSQIDSLPPLREVIAQHQLSARKALGQNFLLDLNLTAKIARQAGELDQFDIIEIGPGPGGLTRGLLAEGAKRVIVLEKDERCLAALKSIGENYPGRLTILHGDALEINPFEITDLPVKIVANLPYNVGTELLIRWLTPSSWPPQWVSLTLMFQKEVAERIIAKPGNKSYGRLSILSQLKCDAKIVMTLPKEVFTPSPKVESAVVHIVALNAPKFEVNMNIFETLVARAFNQRRKMLRTSLKGMAPHIEDLLTQADIAPTDRAENISVAKFCKLSTLL